MEHDVSVARGRANKEAQGGIGFGGYGRGMENQVVQWRLCGGSIVGVLSTKYPVLRLGRSELRASTVHLRNFSVILQHLS